MNLFRFFGGLFRSARLDREMDDEMRAHLERETEQNIARGMAPAEAARTAAREFGWRDRLREEARDESGVFALDTLVRDVRVGARSLRKTPGFTAIAVATLALGIGVNTAMFGIVNRLLFQPAPYPDADRLVRVFRSSAQSQSWPQSLPNFDDLREQSRSFFSLTAFCLWSYSLAEPGQPAEQLPGATASADLFTTIGVQPALGRAFTADEQLPGRDRVAVLSHACWQRRFAGASDIVGRAIRIDGVEVIVVGVMPEVAAYPQFWGRVDVWRPLTLSHDWRENRGTPWLQVIGRLEPRVTIEQAQAELSGIAARLAQEFPATNAGSGLRVVSMHKSAVDDVRRNVTWLTLGLAGFVLLIACANLANLQLARSAARARDLAIRAALGASRLRLTRQLLTESLLLALAGGALGVALAAAISRGLSARFIDAAGGAPFALEWRSLGFALAAAFFAGLLSGSVPAWFASRADVNLALKQGGRGTVGGRAHHRLRHGLIVAEVAFSLLLLAGSGFFIRGLQRMAARDPGWTTTGLLSGTVTLPDNRYATDEQRRVFHEALLRRLAVLPGVEHVALASSLPIVAEGNSAAVVVEGQPEPPQGQEPLAYGFVVSPGFFETLRIRLVEGRSFPELVRPEDPPTVVINETMARRFWPHESAVGKRIRNLDPANRGWQEIIGVVRDVTFPGHFGALDTRLQVYRPLAREAWGYVTIALRSAAPGPLADSLRRAVAELDGDLPVVGLRTVDQTLEYRRHNLQVINQLLGAFAALGLVLAAVGLYGVISGLVVQRTQEFGVRMALGARTGEVLWLVLRKGAGLAAVGVAVGLVGAAALLHVLSRLIPGLPGQDPLGLALVVGLLFGVALLACLLPARRATKVDPMIALRAD